MLLFIGIVLVYSKKLECFNSYCIIRIGRIVGSFVCFLAEKSRELIIDTDKTILPRGADKNEKMVFQTVVKRSEICSVESTFHEGKRIVSDDCFFHAL